MYKNIFCNYQLCFSLDDGGENRPFKKQKTDSNQEQKDKPSGEANGAKIEVKVDQE